MERKRKPVILMFLFIPCIISAGVPDILSAPSVYKIKLNRSVCLPCKVRYQSDISRERVLFYWSKDNSTVWNWPRYRVKENKCLKIRNVQYSDEGDYICYAINSYGKKSFVTRKLVVIGGEHDEKKLNATLLKVLPPTKIVKPTKSYPVPSMFIDWLKRTAVLVKKYFYIGRKGKLKCAVEGSPVPSITWYKKGERLSSSRAVSFSGKLNSLVFRKFSSSDSGTYTCIADNAAGKVNMSFIVKSNNDNEPMKNPPASPISKTRYVRTGENVTLTCHSKAVRVKLMQWHVPKKVQKLTKKTGDGVFKDIGRRTYSRKIIEKPKVVVNSSRFETYQILNFSKEIHVGQYRCLVLYKKSKKLHTVKIVNIQSKSDEEKSSKHRQSDQSTLILFIGIPVFAGVLSMVLAIICIRCYHYHKKRLFREKEAKYASNMNSHKSAYDEEDTLSMQILPAHYLANSLRSHQKNSIDDDESALISPPASIDNPKDRYPNILKDSYVSENGKTTLIPNVNNINQENEINCNHIERKPFKCSKTEINLSNETNSASEGCWPGEKLQPGDIDYINFKDAECLSRRDSASVKPLKSGYSSSENKKHRRKRKNKTNLDETENLFSRTDVDNDLPSLELSEAPEYDDYLLQREIKNWEPLIRDSTRLKDKTKLGAVP